ERLKAIITTEGVYFVRAKGIPSPESIVLLVKYADLFECQPLFGDGKHYIELVMNADNSTVPTPSKNPSKRPRVRCDDQKIAQKVSQKINYSKNLYDEVKQTVTPEPKETLSPSASFDRD
ncbi:Vacuolar protein sorting-associated protein 13D, partial [Exaiptasia diaphana]